MPKSLPEDWIQGTRNTLNVRDDLGIKKLGAPANLRVRRNKGKTTANLFAEFLPHPDEDPRPHAGRTRNGSGKRLTVSASMGTPEPFEAGKRAIQWALEWQKQAKTIQEEQEQDSQHHLEVYWDSWFEREKKTRQTKRNYDRWIRDETKKWDGEGYGLKHQPWAKKPVDQINSIDLEDYWTVLDARRTAENNMAGTKKQQKTLLNKLLKEARPDFPHLRLPDYPEITTQLKQVRHLKLDEWNRLLAKVIDLSGGAARKPLTPTEYRNLQFSSAKRANQRNWVDLYDSLMVLWFFHLRAEDMPRLLSEWFTDEGEEIVCLLEVTKGDRTIKKTRHFRPDAVSNWRRTAQRKPKGYLAFPHMDRDAKNPAESSVLDCFNDLLRQALDQCNPPIPSKGVTSTTIRHTAFRLTLEEVPELGQYPGIVTFAENGHTSPPMLQQTYLKYIEEERLAKQLRSKMKPGEYSMVRRVDLE